MHYYNARWYDADLGRFISEDPVGDPNNPNLYSYGANNPLTRIDPTGLFWDGYETDWDTEDGYNGYLATEEDMAGAGTHDNSSSYSSSSSDIGYSGDSGGFWESLGNYLAGNGWRSDREVSKEYQEKYERYKEEYIKEHGKPAWDVLEYAVKESKLSFGDYFAKNNINMNTVEFHISWYYSSRPDERRTMIAELGYV